MSDIKILKFEKEGCIPCKRVGELLDERGIIYDAFNAFDSPDLALKYKIRSLPTLLLLKEGVEIKRVVGFERDLILELIKEI